MSSLQADRQVFFCLFGREIADYLHSKWASIEELVEPGIKAKVHRAY